MKLKPADFIRLRQSIEDARVRLETAPDPLFGPITGGLANALDDIEGLLWRLREIEGLSRPFKEKS